MLSALSEIKVDIGKFFSVDNPPAVNFFIVSITEFIIVYLMILFPQIQTLSMTFFFSSIIFLTVYCGIKSGIYALFLSHILEITFIDGNLRMFNTLRGFLHFSICVVTTLVVSIMVNEKKKLSKAIHHQAFHDPLTGLPNRRLFEERLKLVKQRAKRNNEKFAVLYMDLNKFKDINDNYGHDIGDELLKEVANRLSGCIRKEDTVSRLGGDEFVLVLVEVKDIKDIERIAKNILEKISIPFNFKGTVVNTSASIGVAIYPDHSKGYKALIKKADKALYDAKSNSTLSYKIYDTNMNFEGVGARTIENH